MFLDLDARESKFEKERNKRAEAAKRKQEENERKKREYERNQREMEELARVERVKREAEEERQMELQLAEAQLTGGISCSGELTAALDTTGAEDDRVVLSQSYFDTLMKHDAFAVGPAFFRLTCSATGTVTHCGVREFTAMEDTVILPQKVVDSLFGEGGIVGTVAIKYVRLPKVTSVKLQPAENKFYSLENVKLMLEDNMKHHSTLTVGDVVSVWHRGQKYTLKVSAMQPEQQGTLIDTDVEVDLDESVEYRQHIQKQEETAAQSAEKAPPGHVLGTAAASSSGGGAVVTADSVPKTVFKAASTSAPTPPVLNSIPVPDEPSRDAEGAISSKFRIAGGNLTRRFLTSDRLEVLFAFVRSQADGSNAQLREMCEAGRVLQLTTRFPNRVILETDDVVQNGNSLADAGIASSIDFIVGTA